MLLLKDGNSAIVDHNRREIFQSGSSGSENWFCDRSTTVGSTLCEGLVERIYVDMAYRFVNKLRHCESGRDLKVLFTRHGAVLVTQSCYPAALKPERT